MYVQPVDVCCESITLRCTQVLHRVVHNCVQLVYTTVTGVCSHHVEIQKLQELQTATEKVRREKWIEEKTKKIKVRLVFVNDASDSNLQRHLSSYRIAYVFVGIIQVLFIPVQRV